jgi:hypothetical protein
MALRAATLRFRLSELLSWEKRRDKIPLFICKVHTIFNAKKANIRQDLKAVKRPVLVQRGEGGNYSTALFIFSKVKEDLQPDYR